MKAGSSAKKSLKKPPVRIADIPGHSSVRMVEDADDPHFERGVGVSENGKAYFYSKRRGTSADYRRKIRQARKKYGGLLENWTLDDYLRDKRGEAEQEWENHG